MTKEQYKRAKELKSVELYAETVLDGFYLIKSGRKAHLKLIVQEDDQYNLDDAALEAVLDTLISMYEERLNQIQKEFKEL